MTLGRMLALQSSERETNRQRWLVVWKASTSVTPMACAPVPTSPRRTPTRPRTRSSESTTGGADREGATERARRARTGGAADVETRRRAKAEHDQCDEYHHGGGESNNLHASTTSQFFSATDE